MNKTIIALCVFCQVFFCGCYNAEFPSPDKYDTRNTGVQFYHDGQSPTIWILGDSHAWELCDIPQTGNRVINISYPGITSIGIINRLWMLSEAHAGDYIIISTGMCDKTFGLDIDLWQNNIDYIVEHLRPIFGDHIIIFPLWESIGGDHSAMNQYYIDNYKSYLLDFTIDIETESNDGCHATPEVYRDKIIPAIMERIK